MLREMITVQLKQRKDELGIPYEAIAARADLGVSTVKRAFSGGDVTLESLEKMLEALDCSLQIKANSSSQTLYKKQIENKVKVVVNRVVKTSALEDQSPDSSATKRLYASAKKAVMSMPKSKIWS